MFHAMMDNLGVMDIIAPFSESNEVVLAIQSRDWNRTLDALSSGVPLTQLTSTKCGVLHLAAQYNFVQLIEYMHNQTAIIEEKDGEGNTPLHYASRNGQIETATILINFGADVLAKNSRKQTAYDVASTLVLRQYLLPLQLRAENDRGLAPEIPGVTTAKSLGLGPKIATGPPPPPLPPPPPPPPHSHQQMRANDMHLTGMPGSGTATPQAVPSPIAPWQPVADGFASSNSPMRTATDQQTTSGALPPPSQSMAPPQYNQFSAFNGNSANQPTLASRYVAYGKSTPPQQATHAPYQAPQTKQQRAGFVQHQDFTPVQQPFQASASFNPPAQPLHAPPGVTSKPLAQAAPTTKIEGDNTALSPTFTGELEEVSLSSTSSAIM